MPEQIYYSFQRLNLAQFATFEYFAEEVAPLELASSFGFSYNFDDSIVCCTCGVTITRTNSPVLKAELNSFFKLPAETVSVITEDGCLILPVSLMTQFASLCYGSMRGVIYAKTMGTPLENIMLPPSDLQQIFTMPARFTK